MRKKKQKGKLVPGLNEGRQKVNEGKYVGGTGCQGEVRSQKG